MNFSVVVVVKVVMRGWKVVVLMQSVIDKWSADWVLAMRIHDDCLVNGHLLTWRMPLFEDNWVSQPLELKCCVVIGGFDLIGFSWGGKAHARGPPVRDASLFHGIAEFLDSFDFVQTWGIWRGFGTQGGWLCDQLKVFVSQSLHGVVDVN